MKVLLVEDSPVLGTALVRGFVAEGFTVDHAASGEDALLRLIAAEYDVVVLDWMLPGLSGLDVLAQLRGRMRLSTPVLVLSARAEVADRIRGLEVGADDYLPKPFDFGELVARVRALGRRSAAVSAPVVTVGALTVETSARVARVGEQPLELTRSEYLILEALMTRRGTVLPKGWLLERLHDADSFAGPNVIEVFISGLRRKLRDAGAGDPIVTRRGHGYVIPADDGGAEAGALGE
ncbi:MAG: response regulator transcription factor [Planctomycetota bacterium]